MPISPHKKIATRPKKVAPGAHGANGRPRVPTIPLFCFEDVIGEWRRLQDGTADDSVSSDQGDAKRRKALESIIQDSRSPERDLILGDDAKAARITEIGETMPNFADVVAIIVGALKASQRGRLPLRLPPLLLVGPPGIGKTHFVNTIANAMQTTARSISLNLLDDVGHLVGHSTSWRSARIGVIAKTLLDCPTASPIFIGDELDKIPPAWNGENPVDIFHTLLERENAKAFRDQFLDFPIRADWALWAFTANDLAKIPATILDRLLILRVARLDEAQKRAFIRRRIAEVIGAYDGVFRAEINDEALDILARADTRKMFRIVDIAIGLAAAAGRNRLLPRDFEESERLCGQACEQKRFGFL